MIHETRFTHRLQLALYLAHEQKCDDKSGKAPCRSRGMSNFTSDWHRLCTTDTHDILCHEWDAIQSMNRSIVTSYLDKTWLSYKKWFLKASTSHIAQYKIIVTLRVDGGHETLMKWSVSPMTIKKANATRLDLFIRLDHFVGCQGLLINTPSFIRKKFSQTKFTILVTPSLVQC